MAKNGVKPNRLGIFRAGLEGFQALLDFTHTAREGKLPSILQHDDMFAADRGLNGFDAIHIHNR